jgi:predicted nucleic acid-binding protein
MTDPNVHRRDLLRSMAAAGSAVAVGGLTAACADPSAPSPPVSATARVIRALQRVAENALSSAWLAYFADTPNADTFAAAIENERHLVTPAVCLLEVFKVIARQRGESDALQAVAVMQQGRVIDLDATLALRAASLALEHKLPPAASIVYATARELGAIVWTQDADFKGLRDVEYAPT